MFLTWYFAPGSEMLISWKNAIYTQADNTGKNYFRELNATLGSAAANNFSIKLLYYLDYQNIRKIFRKHGKGLTDGMSDYGFGGRGKQGTF